MKKQRKDKRQEQIQAIEELLTRRISDLTRSKEEGAVQMTEDQEKAVIWTETNLTILMNSFGEAGDVLRVDMQTISKPVLSVMDHQLQSLQTALDSKRDEDAINHQDRIKCMPLLVQIDKALREYSESTHDKTILTVLTKITENYPQVSVGGDLAAALALLNAKRFDALAAWGDEVAKRANELATDKK